ncbi:MAG: marine proteobacterial sortase target protein [Motiliproteus sp.]|nr:marine proteobacterial sortase target protein [Motiliproteus sp.]MCW9051666.1 marine proteobacterial sortase target protein [Motiliproteus sp.]
MPSAKGLILFCLCSLSSMLMANESKENANLELKIENGSSYQALLQHTDVHFDITGLLVRTRVIQTFSNGSSQWAEGIYTYPLPENAAVDRLRMKIGERVIEGQIKERQQARKTYEQAKQQGQRASLIEQQRPNIFTTSVANIAPGDAVIIEIEYQQQVQFDSGQFRLRFPMVVAPRYIPGTPLMAMELPTMELSTKEQPIKDQPALEAASQATQSTPITIGHNGFGWAPATDQVTDAPLITPPVANPGDTLPNRVSISADLKAGFNIKQILSSYHRIDIQQTDASKATINLADGPVKAERDFELVWLPMDSELPQAALLNHHLEGNEYGLLMVLPPTIKQQGQQLTKAVTLVLDISGSMHGESIRQAKLSLQQAVNKLRPEDRFNIIVFNNQTRSLFPQPVAASNKNRQRALAYVTGLEAGGGTEMAAAISQALSQPPQTGFVEQVLFITDGAVGNEDALFRLIRSQLSNQRLYTVGIGSAPNSHFMTKAAQMGKGTFTFIGDTHEVQAKMDLLLNKLSSPQLTDIELHSTVVLDHYPQNIPDLYRGEPLMLSFRTDQLPKQVDITGYLGEKRWQQRFKFQPGVDNPAVSVLWGRSKIASLMDSYRLADDAEKRSILKQQVIDTALIHHLVSRFTSLIAVDVTPARPSTDVLNTQAEKTELPKGWSHRKVFGTAKTATPAQQQMMTGLVLLIIAGLCWLIGRRSYHLTGLVNSLPTRLSSQLSISV